MSEPRRTRPAWVSWLPTAVIALLIVGVAVLSGVLISSGVGQPVGAPSRDEATEDYLSVFSDEGITFIESARLARFNLAPGEDIDSDTLQLPREGSVVVGPTPTELNIAVKVYGGGGEPGGVKLLAPQFTVETSDGELSRISIPQRDTDGFRAMLSTLEKRSKLFGWDAAARDSIIDTAEAAQASGSGFDFTLGRGTRLGFGVEAFVSCSDAAWCSLEYVVTPER